MDESKQENWEVYGGKMKITDVCTNCFLQGLLGKGSRHMFHNSEEEEESEKES